MLSVGSLLQNGKYQIHEVLSRKGYSILYRATCNPSGQSMVLKTLQLSNIEERENPVSREKFLAVGHRLTELRHPHLVRVNDCFIEESQPFIAMEFVAGQSLARKIIEGPLPESDALRYIRQIAQGLIFLHHHGLLHGEVRPSNIIVHSETPNAILVNCGTAHPVVLDQAQLNGDSNLGFAPPEQYSDSSPGTAATDVYGLAATLYALTTGQSPTASVLHNHNPLRPPRDLNPNLSPQIEQAILAGMTLNLSDRPATLESWLALLPEREALGDQTGQPKPEPPENGEPKTELVVLESLESQFLEESQMPTSKNQAIQSRPSLHRVHSSSVSGSTFPKRALLVSAAIAGFGGAGFGFYLRTQLFAPLLSPNSSPSSTPKEKIEESFPPKDRPKIYDTPTLDPSLDPNGLSPTNTPESLEPRQTPSIDETLPSNPPDPITPNSSSRPTNAPTPYASPIAPQIPTTKPQPKTKLPVEDLSPNSDVANPDAPLEEDAPATPRKEFTPSDPSTPVSDGPLSSP
jgi:eukaryotic-like serine/threonine-protein kinase